MTTPVTRYFYLRLRLSCGCGIIGKYPMSPLDKSDRIGRGARVACLGEHGWQFVKADPEPATLAERAELEAGAGAGELE